MNLFKNGKKVNFYEEVTKNKIILQLCCNQKAETD